MITTEAKQPATARAEAGRIRGEIEALCVTIGVGGRLPRHTELMQRFGTSQHAVIKVLEELQRQGRIVRKHGSGTFVTDSRSARQHAATVTPTRTASNTIVAISSPDCGVFDRCVEILYDQAEAAGLRLSSQYIRPESQDDLDPESLGDPLGFVVFRRDLAPIARKLFEAGKRVVLVGDPRIDESFGVPMVCSNHERGGYLVVKHLIDLGHRNILFLDTSGDLTTRSRWRGNLKAIQEAERKGLRIQYDFQGDESIISLSDRLAEASNAPTAIVAWNDGQALNILLGFARAGIRVPGDLSIAGYDNLLEGRNSYPTLTTIDHMIGDQVSAALDMIASPALLSANEKLIFAPALIERESTAAPAEQRQ